MLEEKKGQFWNLHQILHKTSHPNFRFSSYFFDDWRFLIKIKITYFMSRKKPEKKNWKSGYKVLLGIRTDSKTVFVFLLALMVFDLFSFNFF